MLGLSIKHLLGAPVGTAGEDTIEVANAKDLFDADDLVALRGDITAAVHMLRVEGGFEVYLSDLSADLELECHTCLRTYAYQLLVEKTMPVFFGLPGTEEEQDFAVDTAKARLPLDMWLREEILLGLPIMQKCARKDCHAPTPMQSSAEKEEDTQQPFAGLKDLLQ
ncbi:hypothetical protein COW46_00050 [Candidatus Gracilibacteria bacterium CG17_big_fil_post_rev_8_21_14_2_50_48_13]|nr:MAG: hypothetical protein COW46_00050 [Candidatus Gracilibacteria bacterium CG17_big_fil_post_rev_8_21_14_2_50_48_13]